MPDERMRVAFLGGMGTGKSTAANFLRDAMGYEKVSLASALKEIARLRLDDVPENEWLGTLWEWAHVLLPDPVYWHANIMYTHPRHRDYRHRVPGNFLIELWMEDLKESETPRELYQRLGTDSGRFIKPGIWIDHFARNLGPGKAVTDDLRFANEYDALGKLGFLRIKLEVTEAIRQQRLKDRDGFYQEDRQDHPSETELRDLPGDVVILNNGHMTQFYDDIVNAIGGAS